MFNRLRVLVGLAASMVLMDSACCRAAVLNELMPRLTESEPVALPPPLLSCDAVCDCCIDVVKLELCSAACCAALLRNTMLTAAELAEDAGDLVATGAGAGEDTVGAATAVVGPAVGVFDINVVVVC